jgi:hypothetical protein
MSIILTSQTQIFALLGYAVYVGSLLPVFWNSLWVPPARVKQSLAELGHTHMVTVGKQRNPKRKWLKVQK